jgi:nucleoid-associated protein YgaU
MKQFLLLITCALFLLGGCSSAPRQELHATQKVIAQALAAGAADLAPAEYTSATRALRDAERLIERRKYKLASELLALTRAHARRALAISEETTEPQQEPPPVDILEAQPRKDSKKARKAAKTETAETRSEPPAKETVRRPPLAHYTVAGNETLWLIAARQEVYGDPLLWPLLYRANRDQIRDPRQIHAGQVLDIPRNISASDRQDALDRARSSDIFPVGILLQDRSSRP